MQIKDVNFPSVFTVMQKILKCVYNPQNVYLDP